MRYDESVPRIPAVALSTLAAERLSAALARGSSVRIRLKLDCQTLADEPSFNVIGEVVGSASPKEIVLVGGHLDCWDVGQGASDDGAGVVQSIEALRLVRALELKPRRTLRAVLFMNEENGLAGGRAYYAAHLDEMDRHVMALETDAGGFTPRGLDATASPEALAQLRSISELLSKAGMGFVDEDGGGADISPMKKSNVPLVGFRPDGQRYFDLHHSERDTLEQVSPRELELGAACIAGVIYVVADMPQTMPRAAVAR
jgi:Zn-dependent M28 family amino/carboxypeptidase